MSRIQTPSVAERLQDLPLVESTLVLARLAQARSTDSRFSPSDVEHVFEDLGLPRPARVSNVLLALERRGHVTRVGGRGRVWTLTPRGRREALSQVNDLEIAQVSAQATRGGDSGFLTIESLELPPTLAPQALIAELAEFLSAHPFEGNVFCMTRFPEEQESSLPDPLELAVSAARNVCTRHGLELHLASDRAIHDDLWMNVVAHMWASRYGIAFFEDASGLGINYNLTIEVGAMLMAGRRCALLRDASIERMPTDLVGRIYRSVELSDPSSVATQLHEWARVDLALGPCNECT